ncbi:MAG: hypothetical protein JW837_18330 [Sedimentisphaerales bacterium]|nr:hypothetical protein [Sedimentisphaerales bacterium]
MMTNKPLTYEQLYGDPEQEKDRMLEEILSDDNFDDAHICPFCQQPYHLCQCDLTGTGEDI